MNAKDMFLLDKYKGGRKEYNRAKTMGKRKDKAFICVSVPPDAMPLIEKYMQKGFKVIA